MSLHPHPDGFPCGWQCPAGGRSAAPPASPRVCPLPPEGWHCNLMAGHDGPCPAYPDDDGVAIGTALALADATDDPRIRAFAEAAAVFARVAGKWREDGGSARCLFAYEEGARVLTAWASDPTGMDDVLRAARRSVEDPRA